MMRVRLPDGRRRRLIPREGAILQSFPDWFEFIGAEGSQFNQIGNAVPPLMAKALALEVKKYLKNKNKISIDEIKSKGRTGQLCLNFNK
jgi:DNA (cytosine-5)-methyltransferase 1